MLVSARRSVGRRYRRQRDHDSWLAAAFVSDEFRRQPVGDGEPGDHGLGPRVSVIIIGCTSKIAAMRQHGVTNAAIAQAVIGPEGTTVPSSRVSR
jgi:hypothetical protein